MLPGSFRLGVDGAAGVLAAGAGNAGALEGVDGALEGVVGPFPELPARLDEMGPFEVGASGASRAAPGAAEQVSRCSRSGAGKKCDMERGLGLVGGLKPVVEDAVEGFTGESSATWAS